MAVKAKPKHKLVVIEDGTLTSMANNKKYLVHFPFLKSLQTAPKKSRCGKCGSGNQRRATVFTAAKTTLAGMGSAKKNKLKELLNAERVRVIYRNTKNKLTELTF
jgi:hypothetical protein